MELITKIARILIVITIIALVLHGLFFWMNFSVDSYYYWAIGDYFRTGIYHFDEAFMPNFTTPPTVSPPAYGFLLMFLELLPIPDILLHLMQLLLLSGTGFFLYKTLRFFVPKAQAVIAGCLLILIPGNLVFASLILTEIGAEFLIALFTWCLVRGLKEKNSLFLGWAAGVGLAMTTWKYGFILYGIFALLLFILSKSKKFNAYLVAAGGFFILVWWIYANHAATGVWGLSNYGSMRLWNQIVAEGKFLPDEGSPSMQKLRTYIPKGENLYKAYYEIMYAVLPAVGYDLVKVNQVLGPVAWDAVRLHPVGFVKTAVWMFVELHKPGDPFWGETFLFSSSIYTQYCGKLGLFQLCRPLIPLTISNSLWDAYLKIGFAFYTFIFPIALFMLFLPGLGYLLIRGTNLERQIVLLYFLGIIPIIFYEHLDRRFLVSFYPLICIIMSIAIEKVRLGNFVGRNKKV